MCLFIAQSSFARRSQGRRAKLRRVSGKAYRGLQVTDVNQVMVDVGVE